MAVVLLFLGMFVLVTAVGHLVPGITLRVQAGWLVTPHGDDGPLEPVLEEYVAHYNMARPHRALELRAQLAPGRRTQPTSRAEEIIRRDRLGGLIHEYEVLAA